jgi:lipoyl(octanoyl) transferase
MRTGMRFRFWNSGANCGAYHMAVDRVLYRRLEAGQSDPLIRIYTWEPWCVTLGYSQQAERELNLSALEDRHWNWALRPTGGRAVLHGDEFTYTVAASAKSAPWCENRDTSYAKIGAALRQLVGELGAKTDLARGDTAVLGAASMALSSASTSGPSRACFASTSRLELTWSGRKLVGSAQRRGRSGFVQHGSMPLKDSFLTLVDVLPLADDAKAAYQEDMRQHAVSLGMVLNRDIEYKDVADHALAAFSQALQVDCIAAGLTEEEAMEVDLEMTVNPMGYPIS